MIDRRQPLSDGRVPNPPRHWGDVIQLPRHTLVEFDENFTILERFASLVTGKEHPCIYDILEWMLKQHKDGKMTTEQAVAAVSFFRERSL